MDQEAPTCKHEFVRIYQRRLKGLERRLVATKAYLPVGFKMADFGHLSEGSYCFCTKCRARLFPKRTAADKAQARLAAQAKAAGEAIAAENAELDSGELMENSDESSEKENSNITIHVEELEVIPLELEELSESNAEIQESDEDEQL